MDLDQQRDLFKQKSLYIFLEKPTGADVSGGVELGDVVSFEAVDYDKYEDVFIYYFRSKKALQKSLKIRIQWDAEFFFKNPDRFFKPVNGQLGLS